MQRNERFTLSTSEWLSRRQRLAIGFLFVVMIVVGHELSYSAHYDETQRMSSGELASRVDNGGSITRRVAFVALLIGGVLVMAGARGDGPYSSALRNNVTLACLIGFAFISLAWSSDPELSFRRSSEYLIFSIGAAAAGRILGMRGVVWLGFLGSTGFLLLGLISEVMLGTFHPFDFDYRFCGTLQPNHQAWNCALLLLSGSALFPQIRRFWRSAYLMAMTLGVVFLFLTKSRTSLVCGAIALIFYWAGRLSREQKLAFVFVGPLVVFLSAATLVSSGAISQVDRMLLANREANSYESFSGRLPLWKLTMEYVSVRPFAGYGFDSFWTPDRIRRISADEGWSVNHSHNGFIELMLSLGVVGLTLYVYQLGSTWLLLRRFYKATRDPFVRFYLALLIFYFACMFTEAIAFDVGLPTFCLFSLLWSRRLWRQEQFGLVPAERMIPASEPMQAYQ